MNIYNIKDYYLTRLPVLSPIKKHGWWNKMAAAISTVEAAIFTILK